MTMAGLAPALLVAAPRSGAGKTTVAMGLIAALRRVGYKVQVLKCGPDYIDAAFLAAAAGAPCANVDTWAMAPDQVAAILRRAASACDLLIVEAAMGLFDGAAGQDGRSGAAAEIAARFGIPVLLVVDVAGQAQSVGAVARGFADFDPDVDVAGIILNDVASNRHRRMAAEGLAATDVPLLGWVPRRTEFVLQSRHLGLVQAREVAALEATRTALARQLEETINLDHIVETARPPREDGGSVPAATTRSEGQIDPPGQRIALARDDAFAFTYEHLATSWREKGAEIIPFSPLDNAPPPDRCDICWLPGGYPELHAGQLAAAGQFMRGIRRFAETRRVHGECGGYMVLGETLEATDGQRHRMAGLLGHSTSFATRKLHMGYRRAVLLADCSLGRCGTVVRGHEFHYSTLSDPAGDEELLRLEDPDGNPLPGGGYRRGHVSGTYFHVLARE